MFLETSAIVEYLTRGPEADRVEKALESASSRFHIGPTVEFEATVVIASRLRTSVEAAQDKVTRLSDRLNASRMTITPEIGEMAIAAFARYGKGRGHPARLNFGDCFSYALAKTAGVPLLYVGNDFAKTDLG